MAVKGYGDAVSRLLHVTTAAEWERAHEAGAYGAERVEREGFLHLCTREQLAGVLARYFAGARDLVALVVEEDALGEALRWESSPATGELFPHLYRALEASEVRETLPVSELLADDVPQKVTLADKLASFDERWAPRIVAELNGQHVKVAKLEGEFVWHQHEHEDELFFVLSGRLRILFRQGDVALDPGEMLVVPRGVEHKPVAEGTAEVLLFEPVSTVNTGNVRDDRTREDLERI